MARQAGLKFGAWNLVLHISFQYILNNYNPRSNSQ